ncbi:MAG: NADH:ubiquinone reductase (Na(+)-transporting) subunit A, partial [Verrucomicrobiota bacterium]
VRVGAPLKTVLEGALKEEEPRVINGNALAGDVIGLDSSVHFYESSINIIKESRERFFMGWVMPGLNRYSDSRLFLSKWFTPNRDWDLNSNQNGSLRSLVLTGWYDKMMPMNIMTDYLIRAALAHDTDESVKLGILETDPEDFALCSFICPSKVDLGAIIQQGLDDVEADGI